MTNVSSTRGPIQIKRCKSCACYRPFSGDMPRPPANNPRACLLRLVAKKNEFTGEMIMRPTLLPVGQKGPNYGKRLHPNDTCKFYVKRT